MSCKSVQLLHWVLVLWVVANVMGKTKWKLRNRLAPTKIANNKTTLYFERL